MQYRPNWILTFSLCACFGFIAGCSTTHKPTEEEFQEPTKVDSKFSIDEFTEATKVDAQGWADGLKSFQVSCRTLSKRPMWQEVCAAADQTSPENAEVFFRTRFNPWKISKITIGTQTGTVYDVSDTGLMTGYYEPLLHASRYKTGAHHIPILSTPDDLIVVDLASLYPSLKGMRLRGKLIGRKLVPYDDRAHIVERRDLENNALAWSADPVGVFFLQIQGSGRLEFPDGEVMRVGYDDQNGHPYKAVGSWLVQKGYLKKHELSMQNIKKWAEQHPNRIDELLNQNPSFVFFKSRPVGDPNEGPQGAMGLPLTPGASVAVDKRQIPLGIPLIVTANQANPPLNFTRIVSAQDTGGAITGPLRFDYFWGFGDEAGKQAGRQKSEVTAWLLLPKGVTPEDIR
ncbi:MAG: murein transglycosylase A [Burkholderiales bacterium]|nr:murein transglycosylase A [Burkholderiales bacterium]